MEGGKVNYETAIGEVNTWLDYKKVSQKKREGSTELIEILANAICDGLLVLDEGMVWKYSLKFPIGKEIIIDTFEFKPRITMGALGNHMKGVKQGDTDGRMTAYIAALTGKPTEIIKQMDSEDNPVPGAIALFFY